MKILNLVQYFSVGAGHMHILETVGENILQRNCKHLKVAFVFQGFSFHFIPK